MTSQRERKKAKVLFQTVDPRNKIIELDTLRYQHAKSGHWQFVGNIDALKETVEQPEVITQDKDYPTTQNYFRPEKRDPFYGQYIKVPVDLSTTTAYIKTAFVLEGMDKVSEEIIWTSPEVLKQLQDKLSGQ